jgi:hypothetical protein
VRFTKSPAAYALLYCHVVLGWRAKPLSLRWRNQSAPDAELIEVLKQSVEICDPYDQNNDNQTIQDRFDLSLHRDEPVHKPQQDACRNNRDKDGGKWHFMISNHFSDSILYGIVEKLRAIDSLSGKP